MRQNNKKYKRYITLLMIWSMLLTVVKSQAQCSWGVTATAGEATCAFNGWIAAKLTGPDTASITGILYRLRALTNGHDIDQSTSPIFEGLAPGNYKVVVTGACNDRDDSVTYEITVPGNYSSPAPRIERTRSALGGCATGRIMVSMLQSGKAPYTIHVDDAPAAYQGPRTFNTNNQQYLIDNLNGGNYSVYVTDSCGSASASTAVIVPDLTLTEDKFSINNVTTLPGCSQLAVTRPVWAVSGEDYQAALTYSYSINGGAKGPYRPISGGPDTFAIPSGQTIVDIYGTNVTYYIKPACGPELVIMRGLPWPYLALDNVMNCQGAYDVKTGVGFDALGCYPFTFTIRDIAKTDPPVTRILQQGESWQLQLQPGNYEIGATGANGVSIGVQPNLYLPEFDLTQAYTISAFDYAGKYGNDSATFFSITKPNNGFIPLGTKIELINSDRYFLSYIQEYNTTEVQFHGAQNTGDPFVAGFYEFRITDGCTGEVSYLPITVEPEEVYIYNYSYIPQPTCNGLQITPTGSAMYQQTQYPAYFQIVDGPAGYDQSIRPSGTPLFLPTRGVYTIGFGADSIVLGRFGYRNQANFTYEYNEVTVNPARTYGWICPGQPATAGNIAAQAKDGKKGTASVYTYKLRYRGQPVTESPLAQNTTGKFSTAASGGAYTLKRDSSYDVQMIDDCGGSTVTTIKITDLATAQIASSNQAEYCIGDMIRFNVINLPDSATKYLWTGPDAFTSTLQSPILKEVKTTSGGNYHVTITSDMCNQPIEADVNIVLAAYIVSCYSAVTDTSVNPYIYGLLGNWHANRSYTYYGRREQSNPGQATNIRTDGAFNEFMAFWQNQTNGWQKETTDTNWVWNSETTLFNTKGLELENRDPLGRYNAGIYGYDNALAIAVIQNSRYRESAFEGFEDYAFDVKGCADGPCPVDRRFNLNGAASRIVNTEKHTGRYSLRVTNEDGDSIALMIPVAASATDPAEPVFNKVNDNCAPFTPVLESVRADSSVLLPQLALLSGKKVVISAWVKEAVDCKCTSYESVDIKVVLKGENPSVAFVAHPIGAIIDGWQRFEQVVDVPAGTDSFSIILQVKGEDKVAYFDDIRLHPYNANMKSFVYDAQNLRLMAELDENNYATFYEYDDDGSLTRLKKETERGVKTIKETRSALIKEEVPKDPNIE